MWYFKTISRLIADEGAEAGSPDYRFYVKARKHLETVEYDQLYDNVLLFGDVARVTERIRFLRDELGVTYLMCWMNFGGLDEELAWASIRRFAEKIIPRFR